LLRLIEYTIDKHGQVLLVPDLTLEGWATSLPAQLSGQGIIALYADHGTHEQFHPGVKTDPKQNQGTPGWRRICELGR